MTGGPTGASIAEPGAARPTAHPAALRVRARRRRSLLAPFARVRPIEAEALLVIALFIFAMVMRWPNLLRLPHFTDEIGEIRYLLQIYRGERFPLTAQVQYFGPVHHYLVALCFWLFGPAITLPRAIVCVIGALTVVLTYLIGRELALGRELPGWRVGALGAALLATLPQHIVVNSHVAWANSTTPFYAALCYWTLLRAIRALSGAVGGREAGGATVLATDHPRTPASLPPAGRGSLAFLPPPWARWLLCCGACFGLMLQTHVGTIVLAPALAGTWLLALRRARAWSRLRSPWPYLGVAAALVAYSPVIIDNLRHGLAGYYRARGRDYAFTAQPTTDTYLHNLQNLFFELARMISNPFRLPARTLDYLTSPYMAVAVALAALGLLVLARRGQPLPALALVCTALTMPYFNHAYGVEGDRYLLTGRYVAFLLPLLMLGVATGALWLAAWATRWVTSRRVAPGAGAGADRHADPARPLLRLLPFAVRLIPAALILALVLYPIVPLRRYYTDEGRLDPDNATFLETVRLVNALRGPRTPVLLGPLFIKVDLKDGADALDILDILLTLDGVPHRILEDPATEIPQLAATLDPADSEAQPLVIMMRDECFPLRSRVPLQRVSGRFRLRELYWNSPSYYGVYRYAPGGQPAGCLPASGGVAGD